MELNKTHLVLTSRDLGGFPGFSVPREAIPALAGLTDSDLQCRSTLAMVALQVGRYICINKFSDANLRGMSCLISTLPDVKEPRQEKKFLCGLRYVIEPGYGAVGWRVESELEQLASGYTVTVAEAVKQAEDEIEELAVK